MTRTRPIPAAARLAEALATAPGRAFALAAALALALAPAAARAQSGRAWRPGERVLVTRFADIGAVATDLRAVYAAAVLGLERYDVTARRWQPPVTALDGYPAGDRPVALAVDPAGNALWLATATGLWSYDLSFGRWTRAPVATPGPISSLVATPDALWIFAAPQWLRLRPGSFFADPVPSAQVPPAVRGQVGSPLERAARADPFLASTLGSLGVSERLRHFPVTSAAPGERPGSWWLGTWGGNLLRFDGHTGESERLEFGLVSQGATALAAEPDGRALWFGGDARGPWSGVTRAAADLSEWRSWDSRQDDAPDRAVAAILPAADAVWFGAADGLYRLDRHDERLSRLDERDGLPSSDVEALAPADSGIWVGTRGGLALLGRDGRMRLRLLPGTPVHALIRTPGGLLASTDAGLLLLTPDTVPSDSAAAAAANQYTGVHVTLLLRERTLAAVPAGGLTWAITPAGLTRYESGTWAPARDATLAAIGRPLALAGDARGLWVAGAGGIARWDAAARAWRAYTVGPDLPVGPVSAVLPLGDAVWAATPAGAVRLPLGF